MTAVPSWDIAGPGTDAELARAAAAGDRNAFAGIYDRYANRLHDFCVGMVGDREAAADCVQDAFCTAATRLANLREPDKLRPWLYAIARNEALRRLRDRRRERPSDDLPDLVSREAGPDVMAGRMELANLIAEAAGGLSDRDRTVLELSYRHGLDGPELAEALGVSQSAAKSMVFRLRDTIERCLGALLVSRGVRTNPNRCPELAAVLRGWDGKFTILMRKRIARHIESCPDCDQERRRVVNPVALLGAAPVFIPAPDWLRDRTLTEIPLAGTGSQPRPDTVPTQQALAPQAAGTQASWGGTASHSQVEPAGHEDAADVDADARLKHKLVVSVALIVGVPLLILGGTIAWRYLPNIAVEPSGVTESVPVHRPHVGPPPGTARPNAPPPPPPSAGTPAPFGPAVIPPPIPQAPAPEPPEAPPPEFAEPPPVWGKEDHVRDMFGSAATGFEFERHVNWQEADSLESFADIFMEKFPMMVSARAMLGERFEELREATLDVWREWNEAEDGSFRLPQEYLLSIVRL